MDWLDRENRKKDAPGTWLFGWFVLFVVIASFMEAPVVTGIVVAIIAGWYVRREWKRSEHNPKNQGADV